MSNKPSFGRSRILLVNIEPQIDGGRFAVKRVVSEILKVQACLATDGRDQVAGMLAFRQIGQKWAYQSLSHQENDIYSVEISFDKPGQYEYKIQAWVDYAQSWLQELKKLFKQEQNVAVHMNDGKIFISSLAKTGHVAAKSLLSKITKDALASAEVALEGWLEDAFIANPEKKFLTESSISRLRIDRKKALFSAAYEFFPRSGAEEGHGTFKDVAKLLPRIADLGFDTLLFPPIHPIGELNRKGRNNKVPATKDDAGSPWAVGSKLGGHKSVNPDLGSLKDYQSLLKKAKDYKIEIALDLTLQVAPDHPWVKEHSAWFNWRSNGRAQYAFDINGEDQDSIPFNFECEDWEALWDELLELILFWVKQGVKIFRITAAHSHNLNFWEWAIAETLKHDPEIIFIAEASGSNEMIQQLAQLGFSQGYSNYPWRNFRHELIDYMQEICTEAGAEFFRPSFWPSTPNLLPYALQNGSESLYLSRLFMAATLSSNYGVYGPIYENIIYQAKPGKEEYFNSEKYEVQHWNWEIENKITWLMRLINKVRMEKPALQQSRNFISLNLENQSLFAYYKWADDNKMIMVVNLDPYNAQEGWVQLPKGHFEDYANGLHFHDHSNGADYHWSDEWNYVRLDPALPFHLMELIS
jgi:starch synthase (maltosyl-transferring)